MCVYLQCVKRRIGRQGRQGVSDRHESPKGDWKQVEKKLKAEEGESQPQKQDIQSSRHPIQKELPQVVHCCHKQIPVTSLPRLDLFSTLISYHSRDMVDTGK